MSSTDPSTGAPDTATLAAGLDSTLRRQLQRLRRRYLIHGAGYIVAAACGATLAYFLLDRLLTIPSMVRVLVSLGVLAYLLKTLQRRVLYPVRRDIARTDIALAIERRFPELRQELISAWQLQAATRDSGGDDPRNMSKAMIERVVAGAAQQLRGLPLAQFLNPRRTLRVWTVASLIAVAFTSVAVSEGETFQVFLQRALGLSVPYPRATTLEVLLPEDEDLRIERPEPGVAIVTLAHGGDLPVRVRALGEVPRKVSLVLEGARWLPPEVTATQRNSRREIFAYTFRRVPSSFQFFARGGDDPSGDLRVEVRTVEPPLVGTVEAELSFPAYTGRETERRSGGAIEALQGTRVALDVTTTTPVATALLRFQETGEELPLTPTELTGDAGTATAFRAEFPVLASDRYEIHLQSAQGLRNPRPGSYPVVALEDLQPVGSLLLPDGSDVHVAIPGTPIPVRLLAEDDFGLSDIRLAARLERADEGLEQQLWSRDGAAGEPAAAAAGPATRRVTRTVLFDSASLGTVGPVPVAGDTVALEIALTDNRQPEAATTKLAPRPVYLVDLVELQRRVASQFRRVREEVERSLDLQRRRAEDLAALREDPAALTTGRGRSSSLIALEVGQGRILQAARRIHLSLMSAYDIHLFNGLEGAESLHVPAVQDLYLQVLGASDEPVARLPEFYRQVRVEQDAGRIGPMDKVLDPILSMVLRADVLAGELAGAAVSELEAAAVAGDGTEIAKRLETVGGLQARIVTELETLLGGLDEWNELQDVVQQARALRDAQLNVERETETLRGADEGGRDPSENRR